MCFRTGNKIILFLLITSLLIAAGTGCNAKKQSAPDKAQDEKSAGTAAANALPIVDKPLTLKYFTALDGKVAATMKNYNEIRAYQEMEKRTGIHMEFIHPPVGQEKEQFNLLVASRNLPDLIDWNWQKDFPGGPEKAMQENIIVKLNPVMEQNCPNLKKLFEQKQDVKKRCVLDSGAFYMFPALMLEEEQLCISGFQVRKDWMEKLGVKQPETINDWHDMLVRFKTKDPNENGKNDEIPFVSAKSEGVRYFQLAWGMYPGIYQSDGKIKFSPVEPAYKDYLSTMSKWYKEGLLDADFAMTDAKNFEAKVTQELGGAYFGSVSANLGRFIDLMRNKVPKFDLTGVPWPVSGAGNKRYGLFRDTVPGNGVAITTANKYAAESARWFDYVYSQEGHILINFGPAGEAYDMVENLPRYKDFIVKNPEGIPFDQIQAKYGIGGIGGAKIQDINHFRQSLAIVPQKKAACEIWAKSEKSLMLPPINPLPEESARVASVMSEINTYVDEMFYKIVMGKEPVEAYDKNVETIKKMGIDEVVKVYQNALDRFNQRN